MSYMETYRQWLLQFADDAETERELAAIAGDEKEIEDRFYTELAFGTAGMRGVLGAGMNRMNKYNVRRATKGLADYILKEPSCAARGVVIAYDSRRMSAEFAKETALVLANNGIRAYLFDALRPVPVLSFAVRHLHAIAGVVITASHNPPKYNGYKVYWEDGAQLSPEVADEVTACIRRLDYKECTGMDEDEALAKGLLVIIGNREVDDAYIEMEKTLCVRPELLQEEGARLRIVYTPLHGSGNVPVRRILAAVGISHVTVVPQQELPNPDFPTVTAPNPEDPAAFRLAIPLAQEVGASVVFGTDPDCDRLGVAVRDANENFHTLTGNQIGCILLYHILSSRKAAGTLPANGAVVKSIVSTELARAICEGFGVTMFETLTGFKFIGEKIQQFEESGSHTFLFGFEESFGYLSGTRVRDKDGVNASLLIAEAACACMAEGVTLHDRLMQIYKLFGFYTERVLSLVMPGAEGIKNMQKLMRRLRRTAPKTLAGVRVIAVRDYLSDERVADGVCEKMGFPASDVLYYEMEGGHFVCVRPSGTEPKIKLYVNARADSERAVEELGDSLLAAIKEKLS